MVLSDVDIKRELATSDNIMIYPLNLDNIKGSTVNLRASKYAWLRTWGENGEASEERIRIEQNQIRIPKRKTALIYTEEVIWVSQKLCGTYHSKVGIASRGAGHIGTTLDPGWIGQSVIAIPNPTDEDIMIRVGETFVSLMFEELKTPAEKKGTSNQAGRPDIVKRKGLTAEEEDELDQQWRYVDDALRQELKNSTEYKSLVAPTEAEKKVALDEKYQKEFIEPQRVAGRYSLTNAAIAAVVALVVWFLTTFYNNNQNQELQQELQQMKEQIQQMQQHQGGQ